MTPISARRFLSLAALSAAFAVMTGCGDRPSNCIVLDEYLAAETEPAPANKELFTEHRAERLRERAEEEQIRPVSISFSEDGTRLTIDGDFLGFNDPEDAAKAKNLKVVRGNGRLSKAALVIFADCPNLVEFLWTDAQIDYQADSEFRKFALLPKLKKLRLTNLRMRKFPIFPDYAIEALAKSQSLTDLDISGSPEHADVYIKQHDWTQGYPALKRLNLYGVKVGDGGASALVGLADRLEWLNLDDAGITAAAGETLAQFKNLTFLHVGRSEIDNSTLDALRALTNLKKIHVTRSNVTEEGAEEFRKAMPDCEVVSQPEEKSNN